MPKAKTDKIMFYGTGRRKSSIQNVDSVNSGGEPLGSRRKGCRTVLYF